MIPALVFHSIVPCVAILSTIEYDWTNPDFLLYKTSLIYNYKNHQNEKVKCPFNTGSRSARD